MHLSIVLFTATIGVLWNGERRPAFKPGRGTGLINDLLIFFFCAWRRWLIKKAVAEKGSQFNPLGAEVSHFFFADNLVLFRTGEFPSS